MARTSPTREHHIRILIRAYSPSRCPIREGSPMFYRSDRGGLLGPHAKKGPRNQSLSCCPTAVPGRLALTAIVLTTATVIWAQGPSGPGSDPKKTAFDAN